LLEIAHGMVVLVHMVFMDKLQDSFLHSVKFFILQLHVFSCSWNVGIPEICMLA